MIAASIFVGLVFMKCSCGGAIGYPITKAQFASCALSPLNVVDFMSKPHAVGFGDWWAFHAKQGATIEIGIMCREQGDAVN